MDKFLVRAGDLFSALLELVEEPELSGIEYYTTSGMVAASRGFRANEVTFELTLIHEPLSEEAAVEEDRLVLVLRSDSDVQALATEAREFVEENWRR